MALTSEPTLLADLHLPSLAWPSLLLRPLSSRQALCASRDNPPRLALPGNPPARMRDFADGPLVGTPELITERLAGLSELGMSYAILNFAEVAYDRAALTLFTEKVAPELG